MRASNSRRRRMSACHSGSATPDSSGTSMATSIRSRRPALTSPAQPPTACEIKDNVEDATCRNKLKGLFTRQGDTLILKLDDGKSKTYVGNLAVCDGENAEPAKCLVFRMLGYYPQTQSGSRASADRERLGSSIGQQDRSPEIKRFRRTLRAGSSGRSTSIPESRPTGRAII